MSHEVNYGNILHEIQMEDQEIAYMVNLIQSLPENASIVEWGSGGSTCKWIESKKPSVRLQSIEHNPVWFHRTTRAVKAHFGEVENFRYDFIKEEYELDRKYSTILEEHPFGLREYINAPSLANNRSADVYFIDGVARAACALAVITSLQRDRSEVQILIHDYVGREEWYDWVTPYFNQVEIVGEKLARFI